MPDSKILISTKGDTETLWATSLGQDLYRLENSPFYAYNVSWQDVVLAPPAGENNFPTFQRVVETSGNRTIRVIYETPVGGGEVPDQVNQALNQLECSYEGADKTYLSYNIPPGVELGKVVQILTGQPLKWEYADPSYAVLFPPDQETPVSKDRASWSKRLFK